MRKQLPCIVAHVLGRSCFLRRFFSFLLTIRWHLLFAFLRVGFRSRLCDRLAFCQLHEELAYVACAIDRAELGFEQLSFAHKSANVSLVCSLETI